MTHLHCCHGAQEAKKAKQKEREKERKKLAAEQRRMADEVARAAAAAEVASRASQAVARWVCSASGPHCWHPWILGHSLKQCIPRRQDLKELCHTCHLSSLVPDGFGSSQGYAAKSGHSGAFNKDRDGSGREGWHGAAEFCEETYRSRSACSIWVQG